MSSDLQALALWRNALVASVRSDAPDLSARQMALMLTVYLSDKQHTVRGLAAELNISKPAISRALDRLGELGFIRRKRDDEDRRNVIVQRTMKGSVYLTDFATMIKQAQNTVQNETIKDDILTMFDEDMGGEDFSDEVAA
ncbi:MAG: MarR family transcriptional regulator [Bdellovibrionales bacterium]